MHLLRLHILSLFSSIFFSSRWAQIFSDGRLPVECGTGQRLVLTNVTYDQQGQYICLAANKINGNIREVQSDPVSLQVVGAPKVRLQFPSKI